MKLIHQNNGIYNEVPSLVDQLNEIFQLEFIGRPPPNGTFPAVAATSGTDTACSNGTCYLGRVFVPTGCKITGVQYLVGSVGGTDKVIATLYDREGNLLANSAAAGATVGTAAQVQQVAFETPYTLEGPAELWIGLTFNGTTAKFRSVPAHCQIGNAQLGGSVAQTFGTIGSTITPPTSHTADKAPVASLY